MSDKSVVAPNDQKEVVSQEALKGYSDVLVLWKSDPGAALRLLADLLVVEAAQLAIVLTLAFLLVTITFLVSLLMVNISVTLLALVRLGMYASLTQLHLSAMAYAALVVVLGPDVLTLTFIFGYIAVLIAVLENPPFGVRKTPSNWASDMEAFVAGRNATFLTAFLLLSFGARAYLLLLLLALI